ncbi:MAG: heparinase II/III family protein [Alphaproteobacteria bacterium]|nr:heparinase II/III family protein [Alphaproteobacteria bacterium]
MTPSTLFRPLAHLFFGLPFYGYFLKSTSPAALALGPADPWPGNADLAQRLVTGDVTLANPHDFNELSDIRAMGDMIASSWARQRLRAWLDSHARWSEAAWAPETIGNRLSNWLKHAPWLLDESQPGLSQDLKAAAALQARHLARTLSWAPEGQQQLAAAKGLLLWSLAEGNDALLERAASVLTLEVKKQIHPDGGHVSRSPAVHLVVLKDLIDMKVWLNASNRELFDGLQSALDRMGPMVRFWRMGDGSLARFNDTGDISAAQVSLALALSGVRGKPLGTAPHSGFERLSAGRALVLMDAGRPAQDDHAHAGTLSFEMTAGRQRIVSNMGAAPAHQPGWRQALKHTAAHSTVTVGNTDSLPLSVSSERQEEQGAVWVNTRHDGYLASHGLIHKRRLHLDSQGTTLRGEDRLEGKEGVEVALRFHLDPQVQAALSGDAQAVLLKLGDGAGWRFRAKGAAIDMEDSAFKPGDDSPRRSQQIVLKGATGSGGAVVKWAFDSLGKR